VVGSLFYGSLLGCFVVAFAFKRLAAAPWFLGMLAGGSRDFLDVPARQHFLSLVQTWIGCVVVVTVALTLTWLAPATFARNKVSPPAQ